MVKSTSAKLLLGALTAWPLFYMVLFFAIIALTVFWPDLFGPVLGNGFPLLFAAHFLTILLIFGLMAFYIVDIFRSDRLEGNMKVLWAVVIFMGGMLGMPVYWYMNIWREPRVSDRPETVQQGNQLNEPADFTSGTEQFTRPQEAYKWRDN